MYWYKPDGYNPGTYVVLVRLRPGGRDEPEPWIERFDLGRAVSALGVVLLVGEPALAPASVEPGSARDVRTLDSPFLIITMGVVGLLLVVTGVVL